MPMTLLLLLLPTSLFAQETDTCVDYNGTIIPFGESYNYPTVCQDCECLGMSNGEHIGPCFEISYLCPCTTPCCLLHCVEPEPTPSPVIQSSVTMVASVAAVAVLLALLVAFYIYRRRVTRYVREVRRLRAHQRDQHLQREQRSSSVDEMDGGGMDAPPAYNELTVKPAQLPPRYDEVIADSGV